MPDDIDKIENRLIIEGLELNSDRPMEDGEAEAHKGAIIYDDAFDDNITEMEDAGAVKEKDGSKALLEKHSADADNTPTPDEFIRNLQLGDRRWHLTPHEIRKGENLWDIAKKYSTDFRLIIKANRITDPDRLRHGKTILVPNRNGVEYRVKKGECLSGIALSFGIDIKNIISQNNIRNKKIRTGQILFIPDAVSAAGNDAGNASDEKRVNVPLKLAGNRLKLSWPVAGKITSAFGNRINPVSRDERFHCGIDIRADVGTPVKAALAGKAIYSGWKEGYGNVVILKHGKGYITVYSHNERNAVLEGDYVEKGRVIAISGDTGAVTGPHLHFELRKYLTPLNPLRFLK